jgi:YVTN family beta-propeller protein
MKSKAPNSKPTVIFCGGFGKILVIVTMTMCSMFSVASYVLAENIYAYITNFGFPGGYRVTVVDTSNNNSVVTHVPLSGVVPYAMAMHPQGTFVYVANHSGSGNGSVSVINTATNTEVLPPVPLGTNPYGIAIHPMGTFLYVTNGLGHSTLSVINTSNHAVDTVPVGAEPFAVAAHPGGAYVYVTNFISQTVSVLETTNNTVVKTIPVPSRPLGIAVHPSGNFVYVGTLSNLSIIDTSKNEIVANIPLPCCDHYGVAVHPDGTYVYVGNFITNSNSNTVSVIDTSTYSVVNVQVGTNPVGISVHPAGTFVYSANSDSDSVSVINTATKSVVATIPTGFHPLSIVVGHRNTPPAANAGADQAVRAGETVVLDGSASFDDNTATAALLYQWTITGAPGGSSAVLLGANTQSPSFLADVPGTYSIQLVVTDEGGLSSAPDEVLISSDNLAPTARAGDDPLVITGNQVRLDGRASSDPENDPLAFSWTLTSKPAGSTAVLTDSGTATPTLTPDVVGQYAVELVVSDFIGPSAPDTVVITAASAENIAEVQIQQANEIVAALPPSDVTTKGNQNALTNFLSLATVAIQSGDLVEARNKLQQAIERTDGCVLRGMPDGNGPGRDWITDCAAQLEIYDLLTAALAALTP